MKRIIAVILSLIVVMSLAACGGGSSEGGEDKPTAAGTYEGVESKWVGSAEATSGEESPFSLELNDDGTGVSHRDGLDIDVTWELNGEDFTMQETFMGMTIDYTGTLKDQNSTHIMEIPKMN